MAFYCLRRLRERLWREVWCADRQTGQVCPWLGSPGEAASARIPERCVHAVLAARPSRSPFLFTGPRVPGLTVLGVAVLSCLQWGRRPLSPRLWKDPFARSDSPFPPGGCGWVGQGACARLGPEAPAAAAVFLRDCCLPLRAATGAARWSRPERRPVPGSVAAGAPGLQPARWGAGLPRGCGVGRVCNVSLSSSEQRRVLLSAEWAGPCRESRSTEQLFRIGSNTVANLLSGLGRVFRRCLSFNLLSPL